jgi:hypothetical protein
MDSLKTMIARIERIVSGRVTEGTEYFSHQQSANGSMKQEISACAAIL